MKRKRIGKDDGQNEGKKNAKSNVWNFVSENSGCMAVDAVIGNVSTIYDNGCGSS